MDGFRFTVPRRNFMLLLAAIGDAPTLLGRPAVKSGLGFHNSLFQTSLVGSNDCLWSYRLTSSGREHLLAPPEFTLGGKRYVARLENLAVGKQPLHLKNGTTEYHYEGDFADLPDVSLELLFRVAEDNPIIRFSYVLKSGRLHKMTKSSEHDNLVYLAASFRTLPIAKEVRFSNFLELTHSYSMEEVLTGARSFQDELSVMGPLLVGSDGRHSMLVGYEHGSQFPDAFLEFRLKRGRGFSLRAVKGNYLSGQVVDPDHPYQTVWLQTGAVNGGTDQLASAYREFMLKYMTENLSTRKPYIFYNTWNSQERDKWLDGNDYLDSMKEDQILREIDVAHRMGIDVFVLDTGWYEKTGDWRVSLKRFPDGLHKVKSRLQSNGMKLGLWFGPTSAAASSKVLNTHRDCIMTWKGKEGKPHPVWETEESYPMCFVSRYADAFAEQLIRLHQEVGVTYFKWDAIGQYGCDSPHHWHGDESNNEQERADSYAFQLAQQMARVVNKVAAACPEAIVDFDITEAGRAVGLAFLAAGKFFLINNGPYYFDYDIPFDAAHQNWNIFFYKGPARTWICRAPLTYDKWIPSILFLTHYFPDDPIASQEVNVASLILGQNGIWGNLPKVSATGVEFIAQTLAAYKQVRNDITSSDPVVVGHVSGSPEVHEKISMKSGRGAVVIFATAKGEYTYVTTRRVAAKHTSAEGADVHIDLDGRARLDFNFKTSGAKVVFFGTE